MTQAALESLLLRDRRIVAGSLAMLTVLSWGYLLRLASDMDMGMSSSEMAAMVAPSFRPWTPADFGLMLAMWVVMMVGMMTPSAAPMILLYARVARQATAQGRHFAATGWFTAGYLLAWAGFALGATVAQWALERAALLTPSMASASHLLGGALLIGAGIYQWTPMKRACLSKCQAPLSFIQRCGGFRPGAAASLRLGAMHGAWCVGCCWALMVLLFVGGVMNLLWIAAIAIAVLCEKALRTGQTFALTVGMGLIAAGIAEFVLGSG